jgi:hypothetical protein
MAPRLINPTAPTTFLLPPLVIGPLLLPVVGVLVKALLRVVEGVLLTGVEVKPVPRVVDVLVLMLVLPVPVASQEALPVASTMHVSPGGQQKFAPSHST